MAGLSTGRDMIALNETEETHAEDRLRSGRSRRITPRRWLYAAVKLWAA